MNIPKEKREENNSTRADRVREREVLKSHCIASTIGGNKEVVILLYCQSKSPRRRKRKGDKKRNRERLGPPRIHKCAAIIITRAARRKKTHRRSNDIIFHRRVSYSASRDMRPAAAHTTYQNCWEWLSGIGGRLWPLLLGAIRDRCCMQQFYNLSYLLEHDCDKKYDAAVTIGDNKSLFPTITPCTQ